MNTLREIFCLKKQDVDAAIAHLFNGIDVAYSFTHSSMGWGAYGVVPLLLRYLNNGKHAVFTNALFRENYNESATLLAFLLVWLEEDEL